MVRTKRKQESGIIPRPPVVVVLGHIDHGKTSILDYVRKTKVAERESGGITQHIGAYQVEHTGKTITFIDTPGHEAFGAMRARGARVADIAVLVVAADEGVKPQTKESIAAAKQASIPLVVVINKIDKPEAQPERVKRELADAGVLIEGWGGDVPVVETSAKTGKGIGDLLDMILLVAEMQELKADPSAPTDGVVIEAHRDARAGVTMTLLVRNGILRVGDVLSAAEITGHVRSMRDFIGRNLQEAGPATPVQVIGFSTLPAVGDILKSGEQEGAVVSSLGITQPEIIAQGTPEVFLPIILKTDVAGSLEAVKEIFKKLPVGTVGLKLMVQDVGDVSESDIKRATATKASVLAFRVRVPKIVKDLAEREGVIIKEFSVIYDLADQTVELMRKYLQPFIERIDLGEVEILATFKKDGSRQIVGGRVQSGRVEKGTLAEIIRRNRILGRGKIIELQQNHVPVDEVEQGKECGMLVESKEDILVRDVIAVFQEERKEREL